MNSNYDEIQDKKADDHCRLMQKHRKKSDKKEKSNGFELKIPDIIHKNKGERRGL